MSGFLEWWVKIMTFIFEESLLMSLSSNFFSVMDSFTLKLKFQSNGLYNMTFSLAVLSKQTGFHWKEPREMFFFEKSSTQLLVYNQTEKKGWNSPEEVVYQRNAPVFCIWVCVCVLKADLFIPFKMVHQRHGLKNRTLLAYRNTQN